MASFTDIVPQFNPYVQQLPVDAMVKVGMAKQQMYEQNVTKIQGEIDRIAGLDVIRDVDKKHLQSKLDQLHGNLTLLAGGDFSNFQLANSVGGMAKQITKDKYVQNAVSSTAWYREQRRKIQKDIDEGKSDPSNIYNFDKQANAWLSSSSVGESFSGQYIPHFDIFKYAKETFDAVLPDGYSFDQIYQLGPNGKPLTDGKGNLIYSTTMTRLEKEGRFPKKVQETISQIFSDPRVARQLNISGEYNYRNYDENALVQKVNDQKETLKNDYTEKVADLYSRKKHGEDVQDQIDAYEERLKSIDSNYNTLIETIKSNPDAVRGQLYKEDVNSRYVTMFGQIKSKEQVLANPAWQAQWDMQKEANANSRWFQTEQRQRWEFQKTMDFNRDRLAQERDIEILKLQVKGSKGTGVAASDFEQGNQFSDIDIVRIAEKNYDDAANNFAAGSAQFIWDNSGFGDLLQNQKRLQSLVDGGDRIDVAKYKVLKEIADKKKQPLEDFMAMYINKSVTRYNSMSAEQKKKNPVLTDQYNQFKTLEKEWKTQQTIKKSIDDETANKYGSFYTKDNATKNVKEETITYNGKKWDLTKDDQYDLALYLHGNISALGELGGVDEGVRRAGMAAKARLDSRGKGELADGIIYENLGRRAYSGGPITAAVDLAKGLGGMKEIYRNIRYSGDTLNPFKTATGIYDKISDPKFADMLKAKSEIIQKAYNMRPNLKAPVFTGDAETDRNLLYNVKRFAGEYSTKSGGKINASGDFSEFRKALADVDDPGKISLSVQPTIGADGNVVVEVVAYSKSDLSRVGGMTVQPDEAIKLGVDVNTLYESREVSSLRNLINYNKGKSSAGDPSSISTYIQGDVYFDEADFRGLNGSGISAKGNVVYSGGKYYPYLYVTDGKSKSQVRQLPGNSNLGAATQALLEINPTLASIILKGQ
jgi:hypothetical protein